MGAPKLLPRGIAHVLLVLFLQLFSSSIHSQPVVMNSIELLTLQKLWFAWNQSTPTPESNLAGWRTLGSDYLANSSYAFIANDDPCYGKQWRGLICARQNVSASTVSLDARKLNGSSYVYNAQIIGVVLNDAAIGGVIPDNAIYFTTLPSMSLLILTGNPGLVGVVPSLGFTPIKTLDLHGNGFTGSFDWPGISLEIEYLDISNNNINGEFTPNMEPAPHIHTVILSHNNFSGGIDDNYNYWIHPPYFDTSSLAVVDFSYNQFSGPFCNLSKALYLTTLNVSHNALSGEVSAAMFNSSGMPLFRVLDLSHNKFNGSMPSLSTSAYTLETLDLSWNDFIPEPFPQWLMSLNKLKMLGLSGVNMVGEFNLSVLSNLTSLNTLLLDNNSITGTLDIGSIYNNIVSIQKDTNKTLQLVSMRNNKITNVTSNFSGRIAYLGSLVTFDLHGNPYCNNSTGESDLQRCVCDGYCVDTRSVTNTTNGPIIKVAITAATLSTALVTIVICVASILLYKNRKEKNDLLLAVHERFAELEMKPTLFSYGELQKSTRNFHPDMKLGQGGYGAVYEGHLMDGSTVAIKQLLTPTQQTMEDFLNEVVLLTSVKHRNLVKLKGCCLRKDQRLLVYEYMEKYDLADVLFDHQGNQILHWPTRLNICLGVAQGLHYLHALVEPKIIHRDIKASNILLDRNAQAKIADFGLAMLFPDKDTHIMTVHIAGTKGYLAPEYATLGQMSEKIDVFSYGVLVLEVVSGRRNIDLSYPEGKAYLAEWAWNCNGEDKLLDLLDPTLAIQHGEEVQVQKVITIALLCMQFEPERRPTMAQVVAMLQGDMQVGSAEQHSSEKAKRRPENLFDFGSSSTYINKTSSKETASLISNSSSSTYENMGLSGIELYKVGRS